MPDGLATTCMGLKMLMQALYIWITLPVKTYNIASARDVTN